MINILIVDDDMYLIKIISNYLNDSGFNAKGVTSALEAYDEMYKLNYDMIITDIMMPETDGFEFAESIRKINTDIPILFISARDDLYSKEKGFRLGIDDYIVKPFELTELVMRINAILRRVNIRMNSRLTVGNLELNSEAYTATINGEEIPLTTREFGIIFKLLSYPNKTFTRAQLMDEFWNIDSESSLRSIDVYITKLRDKFNAADGFNIKTVRGLGYKAVIK